MNIVVIDDEKLALESCVRAIKEAYPNEHNVYSFTNAFDGLDFISANGCDIAFLDIKMRGINGLEVAKRIKEINRYTNIVFVTGYHSYSIDAFALQASDYLLKPVDADSIRRAMNSLRNPVVPKNNRLRIQCFGNFEVFCDGKVVSFERNKTKEVLAYLIDRRGSSCTMGELMAILWGDGNDDKTLQSNLRNLISDLRKTFTRLGIDNFVEKSRNFISLNIQYVDCDYYDFLECVPYAVNKFMGEYMMQYSWAELTTASLNKK